MSRLDDKLADLATLSPAQLRAEWQRLYRVPAPRVSVDILVRGIAWQLQERALGGLAPTATRELKRLAMRASDDTSSMATKPAPTVVADLRPGTTLMRSWGDRNWSVLITENGLVFEGRQYESLSKIAREITGAHWLWMGGPVPLGYEVQDRKLLVNEAEAATVRQIMQRYLEVGSVRELITVLAHEGLRTKIQLRTSTGHRGGIAFARGSLFHLLKNRIYLGEIVHKGTAYPGEHDAIVPQELWDQVQAKLADNGPRLQRIANTRHASLLVGLVCDGLGRRMSPSHANKGSKRYRYYITHSEAGIDAANPAWRVSAHDLERIVINRLQSFLSDGAAVHAAISTAVPDTRHMEITITAAADAGMELCKPASTDRSVILNRYIERVMLGDGRVEITMRRTSLLPDEADRQLNHALLLLQAPTARVRRGHEVRLIIPAKVTEKPIQRDHQLVDLIADAYAVRGLLMAAPDTSIDQLAKGQGRCRTHVAKLIKLSYLAPDIVTMVLEGRQPPALNRRKLMAVDLPLRWADQRTLLGCD